MVITEYFETIENFLLTFSLTRKVEKHKFAEEVPPETLIIRHKEDSRKVQTPYQYVKQCQFELEYVDSSAKKVLEQIDRLSNVLYEKRYLSNAASLEEQKFIHVDSFTFTGPSRVGDYVSCSGLLTVSETISLPEETVEKMRNIHTTYRQLNEGGM
ncbi:hypothetical protein [Chengkuizengella axinellae]|uniref:Uncharacterized protein n=1 Tax=Chengkuizengella axinellae TaxID=3064388 RepID=A0ABT9J262_9BACL|nr:hypothetical protein [Chengkuizengella sp. 2205SS18-9]MDP5275706.1 hypothetical protein [Chengkuizengella sp. 2205SS18-9]